MAEREVKWLHSGLNNKNPRNSLGGPASKFEIAVLPANNLFDNITPEEATDGYTDYRCFYIVNKYLDTNYDISITSTSASCTEVSVGSVVNNEEQKIIFQGPSPSVNGYFICQLDWGPQLTVFWNGSYSAMAADMQSQIRLVQYYTGVTVALTATYSDDSGAEFTVTFAGQVQNRKMGLINIIQNNLQQSGIQEYRIDNIGAISYISTISTVPSCVVVGTWNCEGDSLVQVNLEISNIPSSGLIHIPFPYADTVTPSPSTYTYMHLSYTGYSGNRFTLAETIPTIPIPFGDLEGNPGPISPCPCLGNNDECWVDMPSPQPSTTVNVVRIQEGSPINQTAQVIPLETVQPLNWTSQSSNFHVGLLKPSEGFFLWVQRITTSGTNGCQDGFSIILDGTRV